MDPYSQTPARDPDSFYDPSYHNSFSHPASSHNSSHRASSHNSSHRASFHNPSYLASFHNSSDPASFTNSDNLQDLEAPTRSVQAQQALDDKLVEMNIDIPGWVDQSSNKISSGNVNSSMPTSLLGVTGGGNSELNTRFDEQDHDETAYSAFEMESSVAALDLHPPYDAAPTNTQYPFGSVQAASVSSPRNDKSIAQQNPPDNSSTYYPRNEWDARSCEWRNDVSVNGDREGYQTFCSESKAMGLAVSDYGQLRCHTTCYPRRNPGAPTRLDKNALHQLEPWSSLNKRDDPRMISQGTAVCYMCVCAYSKNSSRQWPSQKSTDPDLELSTENSSVDQVSNGLGESLATLKPPPASDQSNSSWNQSLIHSQSTNPQWTHVIDSPDRQLGLSDNRYPSIAQGSSSPYYFQATESSYADHPRSPTNNGQHLSILTNGFDSSSPTLSNASGNSSTTQEHINCRTCNASFTGQYRKGNYARHRRQKHVGPEKTSTCEVLGCEKNFKREDARLKHYRRRHPELKLTPFHTRKPPQQRQGQQFGTESS